LGVVGVVAGFFGGGRGVDGCGRCGLGGVLGEHWHGCRLEELLTGSPLRGL
jgi:hypothetical protein